MLTQIAMYLVTAFVAFFSAFIAGKLMLKSEKKDIKETVLNYLESTEAIEMLATLGAAFGHGLMTQLKTGTATKSHVKIFGFKVPQAVVDAVVAKLAGKYFGLPEKGGLEQLGGTT